MSLEDNGNDAEPVAKRLRPSSINLSSVLDESSDAGNITTEQEQPDGTDKTKEQSSNNFRLPATDFVSKVTKLIEIVIASDAEEAQQNETLQRDAEIKGAELKDMLADAKMFFATNKYFQLTMPELTKLEKERVADLERIHKTLESNFEESWVREQLADQKQQGH